MVFTAGIHLSKPLAARVLRQFVSCTFYIVSSKLRNHRIGDVKIAALVVPGRMGTDGQGVRLVLEFADKLVHKKYIAPKRPRPSKMNKSRCFQRLSSGGNMWESNPPRKLLTPRTGFEDQKAHQHPSTPKAFYSANISFATNCPPAMAPNRRQADAKPPANYGKPKPNRSKPMPNPQRTNAKPTLS